MASKIQGKVLQILQKQEGQGKEKPWVNQQFIIETLGDYPKKVAIKATTAEKCNLVATLKIGQIVTVLFNPESTEYQGKYFTNCILWKFEHEQTSQPTQQASAPTKQANPVQDLPVDDDEPPF